MNIFTEQSLDFFLYIYELSCVELDNSPNCDTLKKLMMRQLDTLQSSFPIPKKYDEKLDDKKEDVKKEKKPDKKEDVKKETKPDKKEDVKKETKSIKRVIYDDNDVPYEDNIDVKEPDKKYNYTVYKANIQKLSFSLPYLPNVFEYNGCKSFTNNVNTPCCTRTKSDFCKPCTTKKLYERFGQMDDIKDDSISFKQYFVSKKLKAKTIFKELDENNLLFLYRYLFYTKTKHRLPETDDELTTDDEDDTEDYYIEDNKYYKQGNLLYDDNFHIIGKFIEGELTMND